MALHNLPLAQLSRQNENTGISYKICQTLTSYNVQIKMLLTSKFEEMFPTFSVD